MAKWFASAGKHLIMQLLTVFWGFTTNLQWNMKWGLFILTDMPVVTVSWLGPAVKTNRQNVRGRLFSWNMCSLTLDPCTAPYPPHYCCRGLCFRGWEWANKAFLCHCLDSGWKRASHEPSWASRKHAGVNLRAACVFICILSSLYTTSILYTTTIQYSWYNYLHHVHW